MSEFDFNAFSRIPEIDVTRLPYWAKLQNFRQCTFWVDFSDFSHQQALTSFGDMLFDKSEGRPAGQALPSCVSAHAR